ncbi:MAG: AI-2E family transporter [Verrucomicrobia bacterium]|nr:AI-2E family transporter [Verrucomicrobiota bacterium]
MNPELFTPWQRKVIANAFVALALAFFAAVVCGVIWVVVAVLLRLQAVLIPVAIAALTAYLMTPPVDWLHEKRGWPRSRAVLLVFGAGSLLVAVLLAVALPAMIQELTDFAARMPNYFRLIVTAISEYVERIRRLEMPPTWEGSVNALIANAKAEIPKITAGLSGHLLSFLSGALSWLGAAVSFLIIPVYIYYFLKDREFFASMWKLYVPVTNKGMRQEIIHLVQEINEQVKAFFRGQCIVAACVGALAAIGFYIAGIDFALLLGVWVGVFDLVPFFGIIAGAVPATLIAYAQYNDWQHPLAAIGVCFGVHLIENLFLAPKIVGGKTGLHPIAVVLSILIWGKLLGPIGVLLAVPLTSTLKVLFRHYLWMRLAGPS